MSNRKIRRENINDIANMIQINKRRYMTQKKLKAKIKVRLNYKSQEEKMYDTCDEKRKLEIKIEIKAKG